MKTKEKDKAWTKAWNAALDKAASIVFNNGIEEERECKDVAASILKEKLPSL